MVGRARYVGAVAFGVWACTLSAGEDHVANDRAVWLSALTPTLATSGTGEPRTDKAFSGKPLTLDGRVYTKGIGTHADSDIRYIINAGYARFLAAVGVDDAVGHKGSVIFQVWADERRIYDSGVMKGGDKPKAIELDIAGIEEIKLLVEDAGDGINSDHADWAEARLVPLPGKNVADTSATTWQNIGDLSGPPQVDGNSVVFACGDATVRFQVCAPDLVRIRMVRPPENFRPAEFITIVKNEWPASSLKLDDCGAYFTLSTGAMQVRIDKTPFRLSFYESDGRTLITRQHAQKRMGWSGEKRGVWMELDAAGVEEHFYGAGMQDRAFDLRGKAFHNWAGSLHGGSRDGEVYTVMPWVLSTAGYAVLLHNASSSWLRMGSDSKDAWSIEADAGELDYYVFRSPSLKKMIERFSELSGRMSLPPLYALGLQYRGLGKLPNTWTAEQFVACGRRFRELGIPCDILGTEPGWATQKGNLVWNPNTFPDPDGFIREMKAMGFHVNLWIHQTVTARDEPFAGMRPFFADRNGYVDWSLPEAGDAFFKVAGPLVFDRFGGEVGLKEDDHEPNFAVTAKFPGDMRGAEYYNLYYLTWTKMLFEQVRKRYNRRYFGLSTPTFTGGQRYPSCGYGDVWNFVDISRTMVNSGFTGVHFVPEVRSGQAANDIEYQRRSQMVFFSAFPQDNDWMHGVGPWSHSKETVEVFRRYARLRYRLMPYIYSCLRQQNKTGLSLIRPMVLEFQDDAATRTLDDQYLFGPALLVAPVSDFSSTATRSVYLPKGEWIDYWNGRPYRGPQTIAYECASDILPLFVRGGAIIPMATEMDFVGQRPLDPLTVDLYPVADEASFCLYEDDGLTYDYEKGDYAETVFAVQQHGVETSVRVGKRYAPGRFVPAPRYLHFQLHGNRPVTVVMAGKSIPEVKTAAELSDKAAAWCHAEGITTVRVKDEGATFALTVAR